MFVRSCSLGGALGALSVLCAGLACQAALELDEYAFGALPPEGGADAQDAGRADAGEEPSRPLDAGADPGGQDGAGGCGPCDLANAEAVCAGGECAIESCRIGFRDDNGMPGDGCEAPDVATSGLLLWFAADRGVTADADGLVSTWQDQSEGQRSAVAPSAQASPRRVALSGERSILEFDGNDELVLPALPAFSSLSFFVVAEAREGPECPSFLHVSNRVNLDTEDEIEIGRHVGALYYEVGSEPLSGPNNGFLSGALQLASITHAATDTTASLYLGAALVARGAVPLPASVQRTANYIGFNHWDRPQDGSCTPFSGRMAEMLLYARGMSDAEREVIEGYLAGKWGIPLAK